MMSVVRHSLLLVFMFAWASAVGTTEHAEALRRRSFPEYFVRQAPRLAEAGGVRTILKNEVLRQEASRRRPESADADKAQAVPTAEKDDPAVPAPSPEVSTPGDEPS